MSSRATQLLRDINLRMPMAQGQCFYCGRPIFVRGNITKRMQREGNGHRPDDWTDDHVFPQAAIGRNLGEAAWWQALNKVPCCSECNNYKGQLLPLDWLVIMPSNVGATRLAARLIELGTLNEEIEDAMERRK
jgi:5-methylcytosine-specific restriction endonuclease McrA